jgi:hypothetical protein
MISLPSGTHIWIAAGITDLRRGFTGLSAVAQTVLEKEPYSGHVFVFRGDIALDDLSKVYIEIQRVSLVDGSARFVARRAAVASCGLRKRLLLAGNCQWPRDRGQKALPLARERR